MTGELLLQKQIDSRDPETGDMVEARLPYDMPLDALGALPDVLVGDGQSLYMRHLGFNPDDLQYRSAASDAKKNRREFPYVGGHLMSVPDEAVAILDAVKQKVGDRAPCTVKLRRGSDDSTQALENFHKIFQAVIDLGYAGAVVHGRSVDSERLGLARGWAILPSRGIYQFKCYQIKTNIHLFLAFQKRFPKRKHFGIGL